MKRSRSRPKADVCWHDEKIAIEIMGATWRGRNGRHTSGAGYQRDCEKRNDSILDNWWNLTFVAKHVTQGDALDITLEALEARRTGGNEA